MTTVCRPEWKHCEQIRMLVFELLMYKFISDSSVIKNSKIFQIQHCTNSHIKKNWKCSRLRSQVEDKILKQISIFIYQKGKYRGVWLQKNNIYYQNFSYFPRNPYTIWTRQHTKFVWECQNSLLNSQIARSLETGSSYHGNSPWKARKAHCSCLPRSLA